MQYGFNPESFYLYFISVVRVTMRQGIVKEKGYQTEFDTLLAMVKDELLCFYTTYVRTVASVDFDCLAFVDE